MDEQYQVVVWLGEAGDGLGDTWSENQAHAQADLIAQANEGDFVVELVKVGAGGQRFTLDRWES